MTRRVYRAEIEIDASPAEVWAVLVDLSRYPDWNAFTTEVRSSLEPGAPVDMRVHMRRWRFTLRQREVLRERTPPAEGRPGRLVWGTTMPGIVAERVQNVTPVGEGRTRYVTEDAIEGPLGGLTHLLFGGSLDDGFRAVAEGLKRCCESRR